MNIREYILSGMVESYVLGLSTPEERLEFERLCKEFPELIEARTDFENLVEKQAQLHSIVPPEHLKSVIHANIESDPGAKIVPLTTSSVPKSNWLKYTAAATIVLLLGSVIWNISLYRNNRQLLSENNRLDSSINQTVARLENIERDLRLIQQNPHVKMAAMKGMPEMPGAIATVYWDSTSKDVYLLVTNLPMPANDKQYQLWALMDGKPIDLGLIGNEYLAGKKQLLLRMKNVANAQAFAVTLETMGGNTTPKGPMYVLGNL